MSSLTNKPLFESSVIIASKLPFSMSLLTEAVFNYSGSGAALAPLRIAPTNAERKLDGSSTRIPMRRLRDSFSTESHSMMSRVLTSNSFQETAA